MIPHVCRIPNCTRPPYSPYAALCAPHRADQQAHAREHRDAREKAAHGH